MRVSFNELKASLQMALRGIGYDHSHANLASQTLLFAQSYGYADIDQLAYFFTLDKRAVTNNNDTHAFLLVDSMLCEALNQLERELEIQINFKGLKHIEYLTHLMYKLEQLGYAASFQFASQAKPGDEQLNLASEELVRLVKTNADDLQLCVRAEKRVFREPQFNSAAMIRHRHQVEHGIRISEDFWQRLNACGVGALVPSTEQSRKGAGE